jgi:hypothetical protein
MKNKFTLRLILFICFSSIIFTSCTEEIELDLKSVTSQLVIEVNITNSSGPYFAKFSKSQPYYESSSFQKITPEWVVITDESGVFDTLKEVEPGLYKTDSSFMGIVGRPYRFQAKVEGRLYESLCRMPNIVHIDTLVVSESSGGGFGGGQGGEGKQVTCVFHDPSGIENFYLIRASVNGELIKDFVVVNDRLKDGKLFEQNLRQVRFQKGDIITIQLISISQEVYEYYNLLNQNSFGSPIAGSVAPANPPTNITPETLGCFSAQSEVSKTLIVQ